MFISPFSCRFVTALKKLQDRPVIYRRGDLTQSIRFKGSDEMGELRDSFNAMMSNMRSTLKTVKDGADAVTRSVQGVEDMAQRAVKRMRSQQTNTTNIKIISKWLSKWGIWRALLLMPKTPP